MRCDMKIEKATAGSGTTHEALKNIVASIEFAVRASLHEQFVDADFVHTILGRIFVKSEECGDEDDAGYIKASLVQFGEAVDHGISTERLGDGFDGNIGEYWERLFDLDTGWWKEEVQEEYEASGRDLLIIDCMEISPKFRRTGVGPMAVDRTIDLFGPVGGLVACKPWPLQFTPSFSRPESFEQTESTRRGTRGGRAQVEGVLVKARFLAARRDRNLSAWYGPERIR
jgi:hypothetical protein